MKHLGSMGWTVAGVLLLATGCAAGASDDRFRGGSFDGFAATGFQQSVVRSSPRFLGGMRDGYSRNGFSQHDVSPSPRFYGGSHDGFERQAFLQYTSAFSPQSIGPRFYGGSYDGVSRDGVEGVANPLASDTDGDGLIDWWEVIYFTDLTNLYSSGDYDLDGYTDKDEFIAYTDPSDSNDWFRITAISNVPVATVYFESASNRLYSLLWRTNLVEGSWTLAAPARMGIGGGDSMAGTNDVPTEFYKLIVELP